MKLLNYTTGYFAIVLLIVLSAWAVIFYFEMLDEIYDSMDDGLENQKILVIRRVTQDSVVQEKFQFGEGYYTLETIESQNAQDFKDVYRDSLMYMENEKDYEPVRLLESIFSHHGEFYKLKVITSMVEEDDLIEDLLYSLLWLYLGLIVSILFLNNIILKKVWNPFYKLLERLKLFNIEKDKNIDFQSSEIEEFVLLNSQIQQLLQRSSVSYMGQKQFIENASHELQTPLAISINKLELLLEDNHLSETQVEYIAAVIQSLERLTRFNKSLLLLSKIENRQFIYEENIDINEILGQLITDFSDLATHRNMYFEILENQILRFKMNRELAIILLSNILKNAIIHGKEGSTIGIRYKRDCVEISNTSEENALHREKLFNRLYKISNKESSGLGLAISKAVADLYDLDIEYSFDKQHNFQICFPNT
ncbi:HAMP domain-containing sensor histidine kinase [uncultured Christiangramia sp.]|uniref:sensor histidine kinase n=1 Tax=uncultured Christiangramia sp. TaxID=503836 RepID=UPI00261FD132|nr:HAMP domain-containing sensor histidine kinase [uncultured Christiangramia sp.]